MMKLMRKLGDGHSGILGRLDNVEAALAVPLQFYLFKEGLFVIGADPLHKELLGTQVLKFGDSSVAQVMQALDPLTSRDNDFWPNQVSPYRMRSLPLLKGLGLISDPDKVSLTIKDSQGKERVVSVSENSDFPKSGTSFPSRG